VGVEGAESGAKGKWRSRTFAIPKLRQSSLEDNASGCFDSFYPSRSYISIAMERTSNASNGTRNSEPPGLPIEHGNLAHLLPSHFTSDVTHWLEEDTPSFDYGGFVVGSEPRNAFLLCKSTGILAGVPFVDEVFRQLDCTVTWHHPEGVLLIPAKEGGKIKVATVRGPTRKLLLGERVALNTMARCSGVATKSRKMLELVREAGYAGILAGTRKTTPGFRLVEKYGMLVGGIDGHRHDLSSMIMLKDNHIWSKGAIVQGFAIWYDTYEGF
jgi:nicotinate-nucleotide pyrophosphorylase (carboxylating)